MRLATTCALALLAGAASAQSEPEINLRNRILGEPAIEDPNGAAEPDRIIQINGSCPVTIKCMAEKACTVAAPRGGGARVDIREGVCPEQSCPKQDTARCTLGDVNGDGKADVLDAQLIMQAVIGRVDPKTFRCAVKEQ